MSLPAYQDRDECSASQYSLHLRRQSCGLEIFANDWKEPIELVVHGKTNGLNFEMDRTTFIHLKSLKDLPTNVWNDARIPEVKVRLFCVVLYIVCWTKHNNRERNIL